ncbi:hypothetical protein [uncultured Paludibaculum sp.]|uniref:hypothetical protein n=1 Tax=uncultured Paludibaculum sp. TaxID=1765020 RepID=UPI002AAC2386|nr:hypothetical protein [uncultured Paludibaculum sp.]
MKLSIGGLVALSPLFLFGCSRKTDDGAPPSGAAIRSVYTSLTPESCRKEIDRNDPNETPYLVCPGASGYALIVRRVDAGRQSIDVVDPAQHVLPLNYQEFVTRHMSNLDGQAEWRVATRDGKEIPIALIVRVQAREDNENPEKVTHSYVAIAKIAPNAACVTDRVTGNTQSLAEVHSTADTAQERQCAPPQPRMTDGGAAIR